MSALSPPAAAQHDETEAKVGFVAVYALAVFGVFLALLTPPVLTLALRVAEVAPNREGRFCPWRSVWAPWSPCSSIPLPGC